MTPERIKQLLASYTDTSELPKADCCDLRLVAKWFETGYATLTNESGIVDSAGVPEAIRHIADKVDRIPADMLEVLGEVKLQQERYGGVSRALAKTDQELLTEIKKRKGLEREVERLRTLIRRLLAVHPQSPRPPHRRVELDRLWIEAAEGKRIEG